MSMGPKRTLCVFGSAPGHEEVSGHRRDLGPACDKDGTIVLSSTSETAVVSGVEGCLT